MSEDIQRLADDVLIAGLPQRLKNVIDATLSGGCCREEVLARVLAETGGKTLVWCACEAYVRRRLGG